MLVAYPPRPYAANEIREYIIVTRSNLSRDKREAERRDHRCAFSLAESERRWYNMSCKGIREETCREKSLNYLVHCRNKGPLPKLEWTMKWASITFVDEDAKVLRRGDGCVAVCEGFLYWGRS